MKTYKSSKTLIVLLVFASILCYLKAPYTHSPGDSVSGVTETFSVLAAIPALFGILIILPTIIIIALILVLKQAGYLSSLAGYEFL